MLLLVLSVCMEGLLVLVLRLLDPLVHLPPELIFGILRSYQALSAAPLVLDQSEQGRMNIEGLLLTTGRAGLT